MPSSNELSDHATSSVDFYALLSLATSATESEIRSAFRKTSLRYHPDKVGATPENIEKFLLVKTAHDVLSEPKIRALYDQTREARERKKVETEKLEAGRRKMVGELERRENDAKAGGGTGVMGVKRSRNGEEETAQQKLEREIRRISDENRRKKEEMLEERERIRLQEEGRLADEKEARERLNLAKERGGSKQQKKAPTFSSLNRTNRPNGSPPSPPEQVRTAASTFEQTILEKLKLAQREKERKKQVVTQQAQDIAQDT